MTPERWRLIKGHLARLLTLAASARAEYLEALDDPDLRRELRELMSAGAVDPNQSNRGAGRDDETADRPSIMPVPDGRRVSPGCRIGPYQVEATIGAGGMGEVFRARDVRLRRKVALKMLPGRWTHDVERLRRFEREARAASALNHPNILMVHDVGDSEFGPYIVMELVEGMPLSERLMTGPLEPQLGIEIGVQVADALAAAHGLGIVHRDIKPSNIMLRPDGIVKLLDFGIAKLSEPLSTDPSDTALTAHGVAVGTVRYMSPEQARGEQLDHRSDLYSLAVVLYEMVAGRSPYEALTNGAVLAALVGGQIVPLRVAAPSVPSALTDIIMKGLSLNPHDRQQRAQEFRTQLLSASVSTAAPSAKRGSPGRSTTRQRLLVAVLLAAVVALASQRLWLAPSDSSEVPVGDSAGRGAAERLHQEADSRAASGSDLRWVSIPSTAAEGAPWRVVFAMGCVPRDSACDEDERPRHEVVLTTAFDMSRTEVTVAQYGEFLTETKRQPPPAPSFEQASSHPVVGVSWADAEAFCNWAGGRLPSEAEWEYAARGGGTGQTYPWGTNEASQAANFEGREDGFEFTAPVASFTPNPFGLYDMAGNVWEWVSDRYETSYADPAESDRPSVETDERRVLRGGAWSNPRRNGRLSDRGRNAPGVRLAVYGIRCARNTPK